MSSFKPSLVSSKLSFKGRLPRFLAGPPVAFTDTTNDNFMRFFFTLLSTSSHNAQLFKKTLSDIKQHAEENPLCYCDVNTTPISESSYKEALIKTIMTEYLEELELRRKELP